MAHGILEEAAPLTDMKALEYSQYYRLPPYSPNIFVSFQMQLIKRPEGSERQTEQNSPLSCLQLHPGLFPQSILLTLWYTG